MATWYIDPTATYNGNGTLSTPASGAGQPGAWNSLIGVMTDNTTYPIAAGDVVFIRSADASDVDININVTSAFTLAARGSATTAPVFWILDNGTIWNTSGILTMTISTGLLVTLTSDNWMKAFERSWVWNHNQGSAYTIGFSLGANEYEDIVFKTNNDGNYRFQLEFNQAYRFIRMLNCLFRVKRAIAGSAILLISGSFALAELIGCDWDLTGISITNPTLISQNASSGPLYVNGGSVINSGELMTFLNFSGITAGAVQAFVDSVEFGLMTHLSITGTMPSNRYNVCFALFTNVNNDKYAMSKTWVHGKIDWTPDSNYPVLNALLPDADNTPWSIRVLPSTTLVNKHWPLSISNLTKFYDLAAAQKIITMEMLICNTYPTPQKHEWWATLTYIDDTTGVLKTLHTMDITAGALESSDADWSATVYGAKTYDKYKISVETPTAIKQNTDIIVEVKMAVCAPSITDFYFLDPDFTVS